MPLSRPVKRSTHHNRCVKCVGYQREDGLWDIEGQMTDVKTHDVDNRERGGYIPAGEAFHDMSIRITIDSAMLIHRVEACIDQSPFAMCSRISDAFGKLEGTRIGPGWMRTCKERVGGVLGCTHMNELLIPLATTAVQTLWPSSKQDVLVAGANVMLNSCHTWAENSEMVKTYIPAFYKS